MMTEEWKGDKEVKNPFTLAFGKEPYTKIDRFHLEEEILDEFTSENPATQAYMITGLRGTGKTVLLTSVEEQLRQMDDWIVIDVSPEQDIMKELVANLQYWTKQFGIAINLPITITVEAKREETDSVIVDKLLQGISKKGKKVLIAMDEARSVPTVREFVSLFQIYIRRKYNVFLIMTGLFENIHDLQNEKSLTFLYRTPKIITGPLNIDRISLSYKEIFGLEDEEANQMAAATGGYPFAYQLLGYLCFRNNKNYREMLQEYDINLAEYVYDKIWSELSAKDKEVLFSVAVSAEGKNQDIRKQLDMSSNLFTVYRGRLQKKGLIDTEEYGYIKLVLPRFREYILKRANY